MPASAHRDTNPLARYASARDRLADAPDDRDAQHGAVLSLARLGATQAALSAYERFGLGDSEAEDHRALEARLQKDLFLKGDKAAGEASARLYLSAYRLTGGTYSGINAATMALLSGQTPDACQSLARQILDTLEMPEGDTPGERYFHDATRAEAYWLLGDIDRAEDALRTAVAHDPLNYTAHAATLKQMRLIADANGLDMLWLASLKPPRPVAYAGHIWREGECPDEHALRLRLSDLIQRTDIGFAYGALAAGADIVMAEACLGEGVDLHLCLPGKPERFRDISVSPFGTSWEARFDACMERAASVTFLPLPEAEYDADTTRLCAEISMGQAILQSRLFATQPGQVVLMDAERQGSATHRFADRWTKTGYDQHVVPISLSHPTSARMDEGAPARIAVHHSNGRELALASRTREELRRYASTLEGGAIHADFVQADLPEGLASVAGLATPLLSEHLAAWLALQDPGATDLLYAGYTSGRHLYTLSGA